MMHSFRQEGNKLLDSLQQAGASHDVCDLVCNWLSRFAVEAGCEFHLTQEAISRALPNKKELREQMTRRTVLTMAESFLKSHGILEIETHPDPVQFSESTSIRMMVFRGKHNG